GAGAQRAADQALDLKRAAALFAAGGLAVAAGVGGAGQHAVFGGHPAFALAAQEAGHAVLHAGGAQHPGLAEAHQHRAFGVAGVAAFKAHFAQLAGGAPAGALEGGHGHLDHVAGGWKSSSRVRAARPGWHTAQPPERPVAMTRSMTAYAAAERQTDWGTLGCELRA